MSAISVAERSTLQESALSAFRTDRLARTLRFLQQRSPYYREIFADRVIVTGNAKDILHTLPAVTPDDWASIRPSIRTGPITSAAIGYTSGTTGSPTPFLHLPEELDLGDIRQGPRPRSLVLLDAIHGATAFGGFPSDATVHLLGSPVNHEQIARLLEREIEPFASMEAIEEIYTSLFFFKGLTLDLMHRRGRVDDLGIRRVVVAREFLSPQWKQRLGDWWQAEVTALYGFSEMRVCNALSCSSCGYFHMPPTALAEVLDDETGDPVEPGGRGLLAVTGFYPHVSLEPRIRYLPGDLAELAARPCDRWGERGFLPLGRRNHSVRLPCGDWITPSDVCGKLADHVDVHRVHPFATTPGGPAFCEAGSPRFLLSGEGAPTLDVEIRFDPRVWPEKASQVRDEFRALVPNRLKIALYAPGQLGDVPIL
ncbi:hypothetical protein AB0J38_32990 [Streptomyces sp. NPDC050095]|uniref:hypothetical protein n=1 Tax=unclassified Streptomyces TaxID=2593676 RepID=UPI00342A9489